MRDIIERASQNDLMRQQRIEQMLGENKIQQARINELKAPTQDPAGTFGGALFGAIKQRALDERTAAMQPEIQAMSAQRQTSLANAIGGINPSDFSPEQLQSMRAKQIEEQGKNNLLAAQADYYRSGGGATRDGGAVGQLAAKIKGAYAQRGTPIDDAQAIYLAQTGLRQGQEMGATGELAPIAGAVDAKAQFKSGEEFGSKVGGGAGEKLIALRDKAQAATESLQQNVDARAVLDAGIKTGFGANFRLGFGKALKLGGIDYAEGEIENTEAFVVGRAKQVAENIKNFGAGTGLSDADRAYAEKMAAGDINLDEKSIRKILDMDDKASKKLVLRYNKEYGLAPKAASPYNLSVTPPAEAIPTGGNINAPKSNNVVDYTEYFK